MRARAIFFLTAAALWAQPPAIRTSDGILAVFITFYFYVPSLDHPRALSSSI
jgi:hypothetical protein